MFGAQKAAADFGFDSIGAVATTKVQQNALTSGFPSAYTSVYSQRQPTPRYFPNAVSFEGRSMWAGSDLQSQIHEQRRKDADYMAKAKVVSTQLSRVRYVGTPHGMGVLPPMVLGQRKFANPSSGAFETNSAREDLNIAPFHLAAAISSTESAHRPQFSKHIPHHPHSGAPPLVGGVLRTMEGQRHGRAVLDARVGQLNAIQQAKQSFVEGDTDRRFPTPMESLRATATEAPRIGESAAIELNLLFQSVIDAVIGGENDEADGTIEIDHLSSFTYKDATRALALTFGLAPSMNSTDLDDTYAKVDLIMNSLDAILDTKGDTTISQQSKEIALTLQVLFTKLRVYMEKMIEGSTKSPKERVDLSKALVNTLGFSKLLRFANDSYRSLLSEADKKKLMTAQQKQRYEEGDMSSSDGGDSSDSDNDDDFDRPAPTREDTEHAAQTGQTRSSRDFTPDVRQEFGAQSGAFFPTGNAVRGTQAFFGEAPTEEAGDATLGALPARADIPEGERAAAHQPLPLSPPLTAPPVAVGSFFDPDTQAFNIGWPSGPFNISPQNGARSTGRSTATRSVEEIVEPEHGIVRKVKHYNKLPSRFAAQNAMAFEEFPLERRLGPKGEVLTKKKGESTRKFVIKPRAAPEAPPAPAPPPAFVAPIRQQDLPKTRDGFIELSHKLRTIGIVIGINKGSSVKGIKKNFIKRLNLVGTY